MKGPIQTSKQNTSISNAKRALLQIAHGNVSSSAAEQEKSIQAIAAEWDNLRKMVASDVQLAIAMDKIPSEKLVKTLFEKKKSQEWSTLLVLGDALLVLDNDSAEDDHSLCGSIDGMDESVPDALEVSSVKSSSDEENDDFDTEGLPMPRINSSTVPFNLEVSPRNGRFASKDPLFQAGCLYSGSMTDIEVEAYSSTLEINTKKKGKQEHLTNSWFHSSIFQYLLTKQYAHATCQSETRL